MSFVTQETQEENFETYKQIKRQALQINSQLSAWENEFQALRAKVDAGKQGELDTKKTQLISLLRTALGN
jgi:hypothetical protein